ncbi:DUF397 domain-containing protein [Streptomyces canus]|uniref:DUF397 domain-containing protein n=1 Tax=Streptomyces canus TaxID=58343 RepID=UPI0033B9E275
MQPIHWQKSSYSGDGSNCVEIAATPAVIHIRDSKVTKGPHLAFRFSAWVSFISHAASGSRSRQSQQSSRAQTLDPTSWLVHRTSSSDWQPTGGADSITLPA